MHTASQSFQEKCKQKKKERKVANHDLRVLCPDQGSLKEAGEIWGLLK